MSYSSSFSPQSMPFLYYHLLRFLFYRQIHLSILVFVTLRFVLLCTRSNTSRTACKAALLASTHRHTIQGIGLFPHKTLSLLYPSSIHYAGFLRVTNILYYSGRSTYSNLLFDVCKWIQLIGLMFFFILELCDI